MAIFAASLLLGSATKSISVTPAGFELAKEPQIALSEDGRVHVAYGMGNSVYVSSATQAGVPFAAPVCVSNRGVLSLGMRRGPRICAGKGFLVVSCVLGEQGGGKDGDLVAFRSSDGKRWSQGARVNDAMGSAREGLHAMAIAPDGTLACAWLDLRTKGTRIMLSLSHDQGRHWTRNRLVYASPGGSVCECCHPSLTFDRKGGLSVMFRNSLDGNRDMYLIRASDRVNFSAATKLGSETWPLAGCPMDGGMIGTTPDGEVLTTWRSRNNIYATDARGKQNWISEGTNPWMSSGPQTGTHYVWQFGTEIYWASRPVSRPIQLSMNGNDPVVQCARNTVVAAWTENGIRLSVLSE